MGGCLSTSVSSNLLPPPTIVANIPSSELREIIKRELNPRQTHFVDAKYGIYKLDDLKKFLASDGIDQLSYVKESFDCDNFAFVLLGEEKKWFAKGKFECGSCFGYLAGDIRKSETDTEVRPHAVNCFVDENRQVWLVEPQNDQLFKLTSNSSVWIVVM
jgi:hypothetical protein